MKTVPPVCQLHKISLLPCASLRKGTLLSTTLPVRATQTSPPSFSSMELIPSAATMWVHSKNTRLFCTCYTNVLYVYWQCTVNTVRTYWLILIVSGRWTVHDCTPIHVYTRRQIVVIRLAETIASVIINVLSGVCLCLLVIQGHSGLLVMCRTMQHIFSTHRWEGLHSTMLPSLAGRMWWRSCWALEWSLVQRTR